ncbi:MAG: hypothetical protein J5766_05290 [Clostridia bacterium]|nr:hypothetical protein [Clostridia bacterium]
MFYEILGISALGGLVIAALKTRSTGNSGSPFDKAKYEALKDLSNEFECSIRCKRVRVFENPDYTKTKYRIGNKLYVSYKTLLKTELETRKKPKNFRCDKVSVFEDEYGEKVVALISEIPCFDSGDRMYDSLRSVFFFQVDGKTYAVYCGEGYSIAEFKLFEEVAPSSDNLKELLKSEGFSL